MTEANESDILSRDEMERESYIYGTICQAVSIVMTLRPQLEGCLEGDKKESHKEFFSMMVNEQTDEQLEDMYQAIRNFTWLIDYYSSKYDERKDQEAAGQLRDVL